MSAVSDIFCGFAFDGEVFMTPLLLKDDIMRVADNYVWEEYDVDCGGMLPELIYYHQ